MQDNIWNPTIWKSMLRNRIILMLILLFPIGIEVIEYNHSAFGMGINSLFFEAYFGSFSFFPILFPLMIIALVSEINAREWLSDMRTWSILRAGYKKYISNKILFTITAVTLYILLGDLLSFLFLGLTHGFSWSNDPQIFAPGLGNQFNPFIKTLILVVIQIIQAICYALASLWLLQYTKRVWETIVYPFLLIVVLPILLFNISFIPESFVPITINSNLVIAGIEEKMIGWKMLGISMGFWGGTLLVFALFLTFTLLVQRRRGLVK